MYSFFVASFTKNLQCGQGILLLLTAFRAIMKDVKRDNRVLSLVNKAGLRNQLTTMLDQLQRCQKSLNEFLEVKYSCFITLNKVYLRKPAEHYCKTTTNYEAVRI